MSAIEEFFGIEKFNFEDNKIRLIKNLNMLKSMTVEEQTFYKKYLEVQTYQKYASKLNLLKAKIWTPTDIFDESLTIKEIEQLNPTVVIVNDKTFNEDWTLLRVFGHTMCFDQTPGRFIKCLVTDGNTNNPRYLGVMSISSDVVTITDRDEYLKWTPDNKLKDKKLGYSSIGSCIMSTQPIGYNFLGGKLTAALVTSSTVRNAWKQLYNQTMVGMTTTSLYGSFSMYNSLKWWHKCGKSTGKITIKPDDDIYKIWHDYVKENKSVDYNRLLTQKDGVSGPVTGAKNRIISLIFNTCDIKQKDYVHGYERGVYYSCFYENTKEFLCNAISEESLIMKPLFKDDKKAILDWWKPKAIERYKKLKNENQLKPDIMLYNNMIGMTYDVAKQTYMNEVGR